MRLTKRSNIAIRLLMYCALHPDELVTKSEIAACCAASENHLAQVVHQLGRMGVLRTQRGRNGGLTLAHPASEISVGPIIRAFERPAVEEGCFADPDESCPLINACTMRFAFEEAAEAFFARLDAVRLDTLVEGNAPLARLLSRDANVH